MRFVVGDEDWLTGVPDEVGPHLGKLLVVRAQGPGDRNGLKIMVDFREKRY